MAKLYSCFILVDHPVSSSVLSRIHPLQWALMPYVIALASISGTFFMFPTCCLGPVVWFKTFVDYSTARANGTAPCMAIPNNYMCFLPLSGRDGCPLTRRPDTSLSSKIYTSPDEGVHKYEISDYELNMFCYSSIRLNGFSLLVQMTRRLGSVFFARAAVSWVPVPFAFGLALGMLGARFPSRCKLQFL